MIDGGEMVNEVSFEVLAVNGETIVLQGDMKGMQEVLRGESNLQILTVGSSEAQDWGMAEQNDANMVPSALLSAPPAVEEENSSDNLPAIGHIEGFEIRTADDGTLLPSTVNAKMADGSQQRLTLFPQIVNGSVTYMVHFENDAATSSAPSNVAEVASISDKIDNLITENETIIANSKKLHAVKPNKETFSSVLKNNRHSRQRIGKQKSVSLLKPQVPQTNALHYPIREAINVGPSDQYYKIKEKLRKSNSILQTAVSDQIKNSTEIIGLRTFLKSQNLQLKIKKSEERERVNKVPVVPKEPVGETKCSNAISTESAEPNAENANDKDTIFIKTSPEYFLERGKNNHPLGSTENPIQLLQNGKTFHSRQPLSEAQLRQISSILRKQKVKFSETTGKDSIFDPETNTRIVYRVIYPNDADTNKEASDDDPIKTKRKGKRGRHKIKEDEVQDTVEPGLKTVEESKEEDQDLELQPPPPKVVKLPRTRSGRLSRPPRYMVRDYKRLQTDTNFAPKSREEDLYMDYRTLEVETPPTDNTFVAGEVGPRTRLRKNVKPEYRCPTCQKIYLGCGKMLWHLRKFPDHSNADEYEELYFRAHVDRKVRRHNLVKLKQMLSGADKTTLQGTFGPLLADAFTLWDFLLFRVGLLKRDGIEEIQALLKELTLLLEKLGKIAEELLSPVFTRDEDTDVSYIDLVQHEVAYALGLPTGTYKVNADRMHLLRPQEEEPPPPPAPPRTTQLATKFEPNLSTKLLECSNDSIDLDCNSKDVEPEEDKKEWSERSKDVDTNSEFLSEFLQSLPEEPSVNPLPSAEPQSISLWKPEENTPSHSLPPSTDDEISLWKQGKPVDEGAEELTLWKENATDNWKTSDAHESASAEIWKGSKSDSTMALWKEEEPESSTNKTWKTDESERGPTLATSDVVRAKDDWESTKANGLPDSGHTQRDTSLVGDMWTKRGSAKDEVWVSSSDDKESKKDWLRLWKEETGGPGVRSARLTSTPESHGPALFSPPLRRNSVSSFAPTNQEELLSLDLHELFEDLMPEQTKQRRPKPSSIESIINEALFTGNEPPPSHPTLAPSLNIIPDSLDEVANLDFLSQD